MEITVSLINLQKHKMFLQDEQREARELIREVDEARSRARLLGTDVTDSAGDLLEEMQQFVSRVREREAFLDRMHDEIVQAGAETLRIVEDLDR